MARIMKGVRSQQRKKIIFAELSEVAKNINNREKTDSGFVKVSSLPSVQDSANFTFAY
jgi:hypothetical protein